MAMIAEFDLEAFKVEATQEGRACFPRVSFPPEREGDAPMPVAPTDHLSESFPVGALLVLGLLTALSPCPAPAPNLNAHTCHPGLLSMAVSEPSVGSARIATPVSKTLEVAGGSNPSDHQT